MHQKQNEETRKEKIERIETESRTENKNKEETSNSMTINDAKHMITRLLEEHDDIFAAAKFDVRLVKNHEARIKLLKDKYIVKKPYRCSISDQRESESQVEELLQKGMIEESR